jgi:predicted glycogen debranching enzyme
MRPLDVAEIISPSANGPTVGSTVADASAPFDALTRCEWLSANGIGGFASGTVSGANARRYHAILTAALDPPAGRMTLVGKVDATVTSQGVRYDLSTNRYESGVISPDGWRYLTEFTADPVPTWTYRLPGDAVIVKRVYLARGKNTAYVTFTLREAPSMAMLTIAPLVCWKEYHAEMHPWPGFPLKSAQEVGGWSVQATPDAPTLRLLVRGATWRAADWWNRDIVQDRERERGLDYKEDLYCPAVAQVSLRVGQTIALVATVEDAEPEDPTLALAEILQHQESLLEAAGPTAAADENLRDLFLATDPFIVQGRNVRSTILAGYPWFTDWGRDTMIALPGLCLTTGRLKLAREILTSFAGYVSYGMIPNRFPDRGETPEYNTVDATLWFIQACDQYIEASKDNSFQNYIIPIVESIIAAHVAGTRYGIHVDPADGLLSSGQFGSQLTWMDAKVGEWVVTPRQGKAVEICALFINALRILAKWKGDAGRPYEAQADSAQAAFREKFVRADGQGLYDALRPDGTPDAAIRPNQVIAAALPYTPLTTEEISAVLETATKELLTPYGLRSLSPADSSYHGSYFGSPRQRDGAYHQGTVWAWLIGPFVDIYRRVHGPNADTTALLSPLIAHLRDYGVGGIAEIFDGNPPFHPNGCPWQAWSVAEVLRVYRPRA